MQSGHVNRLVHKICICLLLIGFVAAVAEVRLGIVIGLMVTGFATMIANGISTGIADNDRYRAALMAHGGSAEQVSAASGNSPFLGMFVLMAFAGLSAVTIAFDRPSLIGVAFGVVFAVGVPWQLRRGKRRERVWRKFAEDHGLAFSPSQLWDRHENGRIAGDYNGRPIRLEIVWQDKATAGSSSRTEVLVAETETTMTDKNFCVDNLNVAGPSGAFVRWLLESSDFHDRLEAATPTRISLFEGSLLCFFPRVPRTEVELSFYATLMTDMAAQLERLD